MFKNIITFYTWNKHNSHKQTILTNHVAPFEVNKIHYPPHLTSFELDIIHKALSHSDDVIRVG